MPALEPVSILFLVIVAGFGGFMLNLVNLWEDSKRPKEKRLPKDGWFWLFFVVWPIAGAGLALIYAWDGSLSRPLSAFSIGLGAPATLQAMVAKGQTRRPPRSRAS